LDSGGDGVEVLAEPSGQGLEGEYAAAQRAGDPAFEVVGGVGWLDDAVEVAQLFLEFPVAP